MICAGSPDMNGNGWPDGGIDACYGDSGGPLVCLDDNNEPIVVGLTSWGFGCAQENFPGVWASIADNLDWIYGTMDGSYTTTTGSSTSTVSTTTTTGGGGGPVNPPDGWEEAPETMGTVSKCPAPGTPYSPAARSAHKFSPWDDSRRNSRIVGGQEVLEGEWPFQVGLFKDSWGGFFCGGSVITKNEIGFDYILSAAHCCEAVTGTIDIHVGDWKHGNHQTSGGEFVVTGTKLSHPNYNDVNLANDLCIIEVPNLLAAAPSADSFQAACLAESRPEHGRRVYTAGWGAIAEGAWGSETLKDAGLWYMSNEYCEGTSNGAYGIQQNMICAGVPDFDGDGITDGGQDACQGDSGGPLVVLENGVPLLIGATSWGIGCARPNYPGVWASVPDNMEWILENISTNKI